MDNILNILNTKSFEVGNIYINFVQGSKQLLFKNNLYDFYYAAICLDADVNCTRIDVP